MEQMIIVDGKHEYDYEVENNIHTLRYSDNGHWTRPKDITMRIIDDGNGFITDKGRIDYAEAEELLILLKIINRDTKYEIVTKKERL